MTTTRTDIRWTAALDADHRMIHLLHQQDDYDSRWWLAAEVIPETLPDGTLGWALWAAEDVQSLHTTLAAAKRAGEDWLDNESERRWQRAQEDTDPVTLREQALADHYASEALHARRDESEVPW